jgi:tetratricopeptide (TPR) repeat protein
MRIKLIVVLAVTILGMAPAAADQSDPRLQRLFTQLAAVRTAPEASNVEAQITEIWLRSGSDTADVLMQRAEAAVEVEDYATAKKLLDAVTEMKPKYAEAWYRRGELLVLAEEPKDAIKDLATALSLEPRHFRAYALSGRLAEAAGDKAAALAAYRKAVQLNPMMEAVARRAGQLTYEVEPKTPN